MRLFLPSRAYRSVLVTAVCLGVLAASAPFALGDDASSMKPTDAASAARVVEAMTGSRTRICWVRGGKLVFFDTDDPRYIERDYDVEVHRPVITPDGRRVVFIDYDRWNSYIVDWAGKTPTKLVAGRVTFVRPEWTDGKLTAQWAYWQTKDNRILTAPLSDITKTKTVWTFKGWKPREGKSTNFQTSADGKRAGATFPWPSNGIAPLGREDAEFTKFGTGCWPQIARDNSYRFFHCSGGRHEWLAMYDGRGSKGWWVRINPRTGSAECPRWANDPTFVVATDRPSRRATWVYLGKLSGDFQRFTRWVPVCSDGHNSEAEIWIEKASKRPPAKGDPRGGLTPPVAAEKSWPGSHRGLVYLWRNARADNRVLDANGKTVRRCVASMQGLARPTHSHAADLAGGSLRLEKLGGLLASSARKNNEFTLEMVFTPHKRRTQDEQVIFTMSSGPESRNLTISQLRRELVLSLRTSKTDPNAKGCRAVIGTVRAGRKSELTLTFSKGMVRAYLSGKPVGWKKPGGDLSNWADMPVQCGAEVGGGDDWAGSVEAIAVSDRALDGSEIKQRWELMQGREWWRPTDARTFVVEAKLVAKSARPTVKQLGEYVRALAVDAYDVQRVVRGELKADRILVSRWVVLDKKNLKDEHVVGKTYRLTVQRLSAHPYLKMESSSNTLDEFDTPEFYNVGPPALAGDSDE